MDSEFKTIPGPLPQWDPPEELKSAFGDDPGVVVDLISLFLQDSAERQALMKVALAADDWKTLAAQAHSLKGSSAQIGAPGLSAQCRELEQFARAAAAGPGDPAILGARPAMAACMAANIDAELTNVRLSMERWHDAEEACAK